MYVVSRDMTAVITTGAQDAYPDTSINRSKDFKWHQRYPRPEPPRQRKSEVFLPEQFKELDRKAKEVSVDRVGSVQELVNRLTFGLIDDLEKVRAIFTWLGDQKIVNMDFGKVRMEDTIKGYLKIIKEDKSTYTELMAVLCREAKVPCVVLTGPAKGSKYDVGDTLQYRSSWNAVYVAGGWRFIHPQWAFHKITDAENWEWVRLETSEGRDLKPVKKSEGKEEQVLDEFFFLTDPDMFIYFCCSDEPEWQLIKVRIPVERFSQIPNLQPHALKSGITSKRSQTCTTSTEHGECRVFLLAPPDSKMRLTYDLCRRVDDATDASLLSSKESLVIQGNIQPDGTVPFFVRFVAPGDYRLRLYREYKNTKCWICDFKIKCDAAKLECFTLPFTPDIGWGPGHTARLNGLHSFSHQDGVIPNHDSKTVELCFRMNRTFVFQVHMKHNRFSDNELLQCSSVTTRFDLVRVSVSLPGDGEYTVKIKARKEKGKDGEFKDLLCYVIVSDPAQRKYRGRDNPAQKKARMDLREAVKSGSRNLLSIAIERFRKLEAEDKTDLSRALEKHDELEIREGLKLAMLKNRVDKLDEAITRAQNSPRVDKFHELLVSATDQKVKVSSQAMVQAQLQKPEVTKRTLADLKSYKAPPSLVIDTLRAAYIALGEAPEQLKSWSQIKSQLGKTGPSSLDYRLRKDPSFDLRDDSFEQREAAARDILRQYDSETARQKSPACEAVYLETLQLLERRKEARDNPYSDSLP